MLVNYVVQSGDTLRLIAASLLGDTTQWTALAAQNGLRAPYISALARDQYGTPLSSVALSAPLPAGSVSLTLAGVPSFVLSVGNVVYLETATPAGLLASDALQITAVNGAAITWSRISSWSSLSRTLVVLPLAGTSQSYPAGTTLTVYSNPLTQTTAVAQPLETIVVPLPRGTDTAPGTVVSTQTTAGGTLSNLGTDLLLDATFAHVVSPTGDLATVSGRANVAQALRVRVSTELSTFERHLGYGSRHGELVGQQNGPYLELAYAHYLAECFLRDPRVSDVQASALPLQTTLVGAAQIELKETSGMISLSGLMLQPTGAVPPQTAPVLPASVVWDNGVWDNGVWT
jgi:hypothetical protein